jgi:glycosyltransferase involved in cell wall biosynthesis
MKVLMVTREFSPYVVGGVGTHTTHLTDALRRAGVDVRVISFGDPSASSDSVKFVEPKSSIISRSAQSPGRDLAVIYDIARYGRILSKAVASGTYDIVHVQEPYVGGCVRAKNKITTIHDTSYGELRSIAINSRATRETRKIMFYVALGFVAEYASIASSKTIITPAPNIADELAKKYRLGAGKIVTIMNGVVKNPFSSISKKEAKGRLNIDSAKILVFTCGRHIARKRFDVFLRSISRLDGKFLNTLEIRIAGDGPLVSYLQHLAQELGISANVKFVGWLSNDLLSLHYRASDVFVSCSDYEASPIAILEAMISGAAVVSTRIQGYPAPSLTTDRVEMRIVPPRDDVALSAAIRELALDAEIRERISKNGESFALGYTWDKVAESTLHVYQTCETPLASSQSSN